MLTPQMDATCGIAEEAWGNGSMGNGRMGEWEHGEWEQGEHGEERGNMGDMWNTTSK